MAAVTGSTVIESNPNSGIKRIVVVSPATMDDNDTIDITLSAVGMTSLLYVRGFVQSTASSVVVAEAPTTAVSSGVLTITAGAVGGANKIRVYEVVGKN